MVAEAGLSLFSPGGNTRCDAKDWDGDQVHDKGDNNNTDDVEPETRARHLRNGDLAATKYQADFQSSNRLPVLPEGMRNMKRAATIATVES